MAKPNHLLLGLLAYPLLRNAACQADIASGAYCFIEAVQSTNPSDLYLYKLPLGLGIDAAPTCSPCNQNLLRSYTPWTNLTALTPVLNNASTITDQSCGTGFVQLGSTTNAAAPDMGMGASTVVLSLLSIVTLVASWSW